MSGVCTVEGLVVGCRQLGPAQKLNVRPHRIVPAHMQILYPLQLSGQILPSPGWGLSKHFIPVTCDL